MNGLKSFEKQIGYSLNDLDQLIRAGKSSLVHSNLKQILNHRKIKMDLEEMESAERSRMCNLIRRLGFVDKSIELLYPFIRDHREKIKTISTEEILEYSAALAIHGLTSEANLTISELSQSELQNYPVGKLYKVFSLFPQWKYEESIPLLREFIQYQKPEDLYYLIGNVNLLAALVWIESFDEALKLGEELSYLCIKNKNQILYSNVNEIMAQIYLHTQRYELAEEALDKSYAILKDTHRHELLYVEKWKALLQIHKNDFDEKTAFSLISEVINKAEKTLDFETIRDCLYQFSLIYPHSTLILKILLGTPFDAYKSKVQSKFKINVDQLPTHLLIQRSENLYNSQMSFLKNKTLVEPTFSVTQCSTIAERVIRILFSDFFKPWSLQRLYENLFPGAWFNPLSSSNQVYQAVFHARELIQKNHWPILIDFENDAYFISVHSHFEIEDVNVSLVSSESKKELQGLSGSQQEFYLQLKKEYTKGDEFKMNDLLLKFSTSKRNIQLWVATLIEKKLVTVTRNGKTKFYKISL